MNSNQWVNFIGMIVCVVLAIGSTVLTSIFILTGGDLGNIFVFGTASPLFAYLAIACRKGI